MPSKALQYEVIRDFNVAALPSGEDTLLKGLATGREGLWRVGLRLPRDARLLGELGLGTECTVGEAFATTCEWLGSLSGLSVPRGCENVNMRRTKPLIAWADIVVRRG